MKISKVIEILEGMEEEHGDLNVFVIDPESMDQEEVQLTEALITVDRDESTGEVNGLIFLTRYFRDELHGYADDDKLDDHD
jgi:hypothetical protein